MRSVGCWEAAGWIFMGVCLLVAVFLEVMAMDYPVRRKKSVGEKEAREKKSETVDV